MKKIIFTKKYKEIHKKDDCSLIAKIGILDNNLFEERTHGYVNIKKYGICKIQVYSGEGTIPHFHIENDDKTFLCCIRLDKPEYFNHGVHTDKLNNQQIKELIKVLNEKAKGVDFSVFEVMCITWNSDIENKFEVSRPFKMPDYTNLNYIKTI